MNFLLGFVFVAGVCFVARADDPTPTTTPTPEYLSKTSDNVPIPVELTANGTRLSYSIIPENDDDFVFIIVPKIDAANRATTTLLVHLQANNTQVTLFDVKADKVDINVPHQITSPDSGTPLTLVMSSPVDVIVYASAYSSPPKNYTVAETISTYNVYRYHSAGYPSFSYGRVWETWTFTPENPDIALVFTNDGINQLQVDNNTAQLTVFSGSETANTVFRYNCIDKTNKTLCPESYTAPVGQTLTVRFETTEAIINTDQKNPAGINFSVIGSKQYDPATPPAPGASTTEAPEVNGTTTEPTTTTKGAGSLSPFLAISGVICVLPLLRN